MKATKGRFIRHGTNWCYQVGPGGKGPGCRCDKCTVAHKVAVREYRKARRERQRRVAARRQS